MADAIQTPPDIAETDVSDFASYVHQENKREKAGEPAIEPTVPESASASAPEVTSDDSADASSSGEPSSDASQEPTETAEEQKAADDRARDKTGRFKKPSVQHRIDVATARQRDAERRAEAAEQRARELEAKLTPASVERQQAPQPHAADPNEPTLEQFLNDADPYASLSRALARYEVAQARKQWDADQQQAALVAAERNRAAEIIEDGQKKFADWADVMQSEFAQSFNFPPHVWETIYQLDASPEILYHLGTHEPEAREIAALSPLAAASALGQLSVRLTAAQSGSAGSAGTVSRAKPPIRPVGGSPMAPDPSPPDPESTPFGEYVRYHNAADRKKRANGRT